MLSVIFGCSLCLPESCFPQAPVYFLTAPSDGQLTTLLVPQPDLAASCQYNTCNSNSLFPMMAAVLQPCAWRIGRPYSAA